MKFNAVQKAFGAIIIANIIWGAAPLIFKVSLQNIPPFTLAFWRFFLGAIILLVYLGKKASFEFSSTMEFVDLILYALTGITINIIFFFWGLKLTYSINSPVISSGAPILTFLLALLFLGEAFRWKKFIGMMLGTVGILAIVFEPLLTHGVDGSVVGNLYLVIATVAAVAQTVIGKRVLPKVDPIAFTFWSFVIGAASFLPLAFSEYIGNTNLYHALDWRAFMGVTYGAIFSSAIAYALYAWGLAKVTATDASVYTYLDPVVGTILGCFVLKEPITPEFVIGGILIFGGIYLAEGYFPYHPLHKLRAATETILANAPPVGEPQTVRRSSKDRTRIIKQLFGNHNK